MKTKDKQKFAVAAVGFLVVLSGIGALNYFKFSERSELLAELDRLKADESAAEAKIRQIPELLEKRANLVATIDRYAEILPPEDQVQQNAFVNIIGKFGKDTNIEIQKAEPIEEDKEADANKRFIRHRYRFKLLGKFPDFVEFVNKIENHSRFLKVDSFTIKPLGSRGGFGSDVSVGEDAAELQRASDPTKEIQLTVSTYTYYKGV